MGRSGAALQIAWLANQRAVCARRVFRGRDLPDWVLLARIVSLGKVSPPVLAFIWRREWQLALGLLACRPVALPRALSVVLREVDQAEAGTL